MSPLPTTIPILLEGSSLLSFGVRSPHSWAIKNGCEWKCIYTLQGWHSGSPWATLALSACCYLS